MQASTQPDKTVSRRDTRRLRAWVKHGKSPVAQSVRTIFFGVRRFEIPAPKWLFGVLYRLHVAVASTWAELLRVFYFTPLFKSRLANQPRGLYLYSGMPLVMGALRIEMGDGSRVSGITTFSGRSSAAETPHLRIGSNVDVGWQCSIAVGSRVVLEDNVRLAGRCMLAGYPGHPLEARARAAGLPETDDQVGEIVLEENVWLATDVKVMAGVRIGRNTVVAAGSVVTRDLPPNVLAAGVPAKIIRELECAQ